MNADIRSRDVGFVSHMPLDLASGGGVYTRSIFHLLENIWRDGAVHFVGPDKVIAPSRLVSIARAVVSSGSSKTDFAERSGLAEAVSRTRFDKSAVICLNSPDALPLIEREAFGGRYILVCHNIEAQLFRQQVDRQPFPLRQLLARDVARYAEIEDRAIRNASLVICVSDHEAASLKETHPTVSVVHIPPVFHGPKQTVSRRPIGDVIRLGFVGRMSWWPNRDAVRWLQDALKPMPVNRELSLFGAGTTELSDPESRWTGHGFVEDGDVIWNATDVALCPVRSGGGVNIKLIEALARGVPVLTTSFGIRGLGVDPAGLSGLRVVDGASDWRAFIEGEGLTALANEAVDPSLLRHFDAANHEKRLRSALVAAGLMQ